MGGAYSKTTSINKQTGMFDVKKMNQSELNKVTFDNEKWSSIERK